METIRRHRAAVFTRRAQGATVTVSDLLAADAADDSENPRAAMAHLHDLARNLTARTGTVHHVWHVPAAGFRPAEYVVLPAAYAADDWKAVAE